MDDLISRSETINKLYEYADKKHSTGEVELANGILKAACFIKNESNIPTVMKIGLDLSNTDSFAAGGNSADNESDSDKTNDKWISVNESPRKADRYLCDIVVRQDGCNARRIVIAMYDGQWRNAKGTEILAWQPLPSEYKQKGAEKQNETLSGR